MKIFVLKLDFLRPSTRYPNFVFFLNWRFSYATFFLICSYRSPLQFLLETKRFASINDSLGFSALCDLPETFIKTFWKSAKFLPQFFVF